MKKDNKMCISKRKMKELRDSGKLRDDFELWVDKHNHEFELVRTITSILGLGLSGVILLKVFNIV